MTDQFPSGLLSLSFELKKWKNSFRAVVFQQREQKTVFCTLVFLKYRYSQVTLMAKNPPAKAGDVRDTGSILGLGRSPGEENGYPLQYSYLENPMDRGAWRATVQWDEKSGTRLSTHIYMRVCVPACSVMSDSLQPHGLKPARLLCPWNFPSKNTGAGCHFLFQGIFLTQGSNLCLLHLLQWQADSLLLSHLDVLISSVIWC